MTKIKTIKLTTQYASDLERSLRAACSPFGSLVGPIPDLVVSYLGGPLASSAPTCTPDAGLALLRELRAVEGEWSEVLLGASRVQLITPTSGTVIEVRRSTSRWSLCVDFGAAGSDSRADQILEHDRTELPALPWEIESVDDADDASAHMHSVTRSSGGPIMLATGEQVYDYVDHCECGARRVWQRGPGEQRAHLVSGWSTTGVQTPEALAAAAEAADLADAGVLR